MQIVAGTRLVRQSSEVTRVPRVPRATSSASRFRARGYSVTKRLRYVSCSRPLTGNFKREERLEDEDTLLLLPVSHFFNRVSPSVSFFLLNSLIQ